MRKHLFKVLSWLLTQLFSQKSALVVVSMANTVITVFTLRQGGTAAHGLVGTAITVSDYCTSHDPETAWLGDNCHARMIAVIVVWEQGTTDSSAVGLEGSYRDHLTANSFIAQAICYLHHHSCYDRLIVSTGYHQSCSRFPVSNF